MLSLCLMYGTCPTVLKTNDGLYVLWHLKDNLMIDGMQRPIYSNKLQTTQCEPFNKYIAIKHPGNFIMKTVN